MPRGSQAGSLIMPEAYGPHRVSHVTRLAVRGVDYRVREWGPADAPPLVMLHGGRDHAATFQFLVDAMAGEYRIVAPDWRGHGGSAWTPGSYWQAEMLCDLDALLDRLIPSGAVPVIGHSMGGNIAALFAALRPERLTRLVLLDALGNPLNRSPVAIADELGQLLDDQRHRRSPRRYDGLAQMAERLVQANPRLDPGRALFLAAAAAQSVEGGKWCWPQDPGFRRSLPTLHGTEEWGSCWRRIRSPVLALLSSDPRDQAATVEDAEVARRVAFFPDVVVRRLPHTSHNLHHDAPEMLAPVIEAFLTDDPALSPLLAALPAVSGTERTGSGQATAPLNHNNQAGQDHQPCVT